MTDRRKFLTAGALAAVTGALGSTAAQAQAGGAKQSFSGAKSFAANEKTKPWMAMQRPTAPISIDIHTHWAPEGYLKAKADLGQPDFLDPSNADMARRVKLQEALGIQTSVLTLGGFRPWVWVTPAQGAKISAVVNDAAIAAHKAYPKSFVAGIELNCSDPAGSLIELNRVAGQPGMVCIHLPTALGGQEFMFAPAFQAIFARAEELGLPIFLHPLDGMANWSGGKRLVDEASGVAPDADLTSGANRFPGLTNSLGNSLEIAITISKLISSGTLDKYPNLTFIAVQGGGAIPYAAGRLEARGRLKKPMGEYLRRFYYDSLVYYPESLRYLAQMVGSDRIVLGTDNMYATAENQMSNQPHGVIDAADFNDEDRDLILRGNLKRLFKI
jgi:aminocarboxymuconate-semialdehyde decarboxylase